MRVSNTNRGDSPFTVLRNRVSPSSVRRTFLLRKATAMDSFAFSILTDYALSGLRHYAFEREREQSMVLDDAIFDRLILTLRRCLHGEDVGYVSTWERLQLFMRVLACLRKPFNWVGPPRNLTWADYADVLKKAMVANNLVAQGDNFTLFKIVMFVKDLRSQLSASVGMVRRRRRTLAAHFFEFIFADAAPPAGVVAHADEQVALVEDGVVAHADEQVAVVEDGVVAHAEPEPAGVVAHADEPVAVVEDGVAAVDGNADEPVAVDEDGDVVMETEELVSGSRGSKRRRNQALSYKREMSRVTGTRRRYNLRNTRAREERMVNLKEAEDSKRKADDAESSSKGSRKRSRR